VVWEVGVVRKKWCKWVPQKYRVTCSGTLMWYGSMWDVYGLWVVCGVAFLQCVASWCTFEVETRELQPFSSALRPLSPTRFGRSWGALSVSSHCLSGLTAFAEHAYRGPPQSHGQATTWPHALWRVIHLSSVRSEFSWVGMIIQYRRTQHCTATISGVTAICALLYDLRAPVQITKTQRHLAQMLLKRHGARLLH
jgi:hypothetical protein